MSGHQRSPLRKTGLSFVAFLTIISFPVLAFGQTTTSVFAPVGEKTSPHRNVAERFSDDGSGADEEPSPIERRAVNWRAVLTLAVNYASPTGDFYEDIVAGPGFEVRLAVAVGAKTAFRLSYARFGLQVEDDLVVVSSSQGVDFIVPDPGVKSHLFALGLQGYHLLNPKTDSRMAGYFYVEVGSITHTATGTLYSESADSRELQFVRHLSESNTDFCGGVGGGLIIPVKDKIEVDVGMGASLVRSRAAQDWLPDVVTNGFIHRFNLGVTFAL
jgi:hypothetical protein